MVSYSQIIRGIALRAGLLRGGSLPSLETSYASNPITAFDFTDVDAGTFQSTKDAALLAEEDFAQTIANVGNHPWRKLLGSQTAAIATGAEVPATNSGGTQIIGIYGSIRNSSSGIVCTEQPLEVVRRIAAETWRTYPLYYYKIDGTRIYHTRTNVVIDVCGYSRTAQAVALEANGSMLLPDVLEGALVARGMCYLYRKDLAADVGVYRQYADEVAQMIREGLTSVPSKSVPGPSMTTAAT